MTILNLQKQHKCLIEPIGKFGDHAKGSMGCLWCDLILKCLKLHPYPGNSIWFRMGNVPKIKKERIKKILEKAMTLDQDQKNFIENKVKELGSIEAVKKFYYKDCTVTKYAHAHAKKLYGKPVRKLRRG